MCFQPVMPNSVMPDSVMLNSYLMLYHIPLYHFPLYLILDCPLQCYNRFLFSVIPDSIMPDSVIPDSCFDIPVSVIPNSIIPHSCFVCYNRFRYTRFPQPMTTSTFDQSGVFHPEKEFSWKESPNLGGALPPSPQPGGERERERVEGNPRETKGKICSSRS